jgi:hypothetical protein
MISFKDEAPDFDEFFAEADEELLDWRTPWGRVRDLSREQRYAAYCIYVGLASFAHRLHMRELEEMQLLLKAVPEGKRLEDVFGSIDEMNAYLQSRKGPT